MKRRDLVAAAVGAFAACIGAGGIAWAAIPDGTGTINGCYLKVGGILRVVDPAKGEKCFSNLEQPISWSQKGPKGDPGSNGANGTNGANGANGTNGVSPTVSQLPPGDASCPAGGAAITGANGTTAYVCSGQDGANGTDGQSFTGSFTSPNGDYSIVVGDNGIVLSNGADASIKLTGNDVEVHAGGDTTLLSGGNFELKGGGAGLVQSGSTLNLKGSIVNIN